MGTVIQFPDRKATAASPRRLWPAEECGHIVILPVVRIERHEAARLSLRDTRAEPIDAATHLISSCGAARDRSRTADPARNAKRAKSGAPMTAE